MLRAGAGLAGRASGSGPRRAAGGGPLGGARRADRGCARALTGANVHLAGGMPADGSPARLAADHDSGPPMPLDYDRAALRLGRHEADVPAVVRREPRGVLLLEDDRTARRLFAIGHDVTAVAVDQDAVLGVPTEADLA